LQSVQKRLGIVKKEIEESHTLRLWRETQQNTRNAFLAEKLTWDERLERLRRSAGWPMPAQMVILGAIGASILGFVAAYLWGGRLTWAFATSIAIVVGFWSYTRHCITKNAALL